MILFLRKTWLILSFLATGTIAFLAIITMVIVAKLVFGTCY